MGPPASQWVISLGTDLNVMGAGLKGTGPPLPVLHARREQRAAVGQLLAQVGGVGLALQVRRVPVQPPSQPPVTGPVWRVQMNILPSELVSCDKPYVAAPAPQRRRSPRMPAAWPSSQNNSAQWVYSLHQLETPGASQVARPVIQGPDGVTLHELLALSAGVLGWTDVFRLREHATESRGTGWNDFILAKPVLFSASKDVAVEWTAQLGA